METDDVMMMAVLDSGLMAGQTNGYVGPEDNVTRAVQLMFREHCLLIQTWMDEIPGPISSALHSIPCFGPS